MGRAHAALLLLALACCTAGGCRCRPSVESQNLVELVPAGAAFVLRVDFAALRRAPVTRGLLGGAHGGDDPRGANLRRRLGFDPARDLDRLLLAVGGGGRTPRGVDFLLALRGRVERDAVLEALGRRGHRLKRRKVEGLEGWGDGSGNQLLFPGDGVILGVSAGWTSGAARRLRGRGRSLAAGGTPLASEVRKLTARGEGRQGPAWAVSRLGPGLGQHLARRTGWGELSHLGSVRLETTAGQRLSLRAVLTLDETAAAGRLYRRLRDLLPALTERARASLGPAGEALSGLRLLLRGRQVRGSWSLSDAQLKLLWARLARGPQQGLTDHRRDSTLGGR